MARRRRRRISNVECEATRWSEYASNTTPTISIIVAQDHPIMEILSLLFAGGFQYWRTPWNRRCIAMTGTVVNKSEVCNACIPNPAALVANQRSVCVSKIRQPCLKDDIHTNTLTKNRRITRARTPMNSSIQPHSTLPTRKQSTTNHRCARGKNYSSRISKLVEDFLRRSLLRSSFLLLILGFSILGTGVDAQRNNGTSAAPTAVPVARIVPTLIPTFRNATKPTPSRPSNTNTTATPMTGAAVASDTPTVTLSNRPSHNPSLAPTASMEPTISQLPSLNPTVTSAPTLFPSSIPSSFPTTEGTSFVKGFYRQGFVVQSTAYTFLNETEQDTLSEIFQSYTKFLVTDSTALDLIDTECEIDDQSGSTDTTNQTINTVDYSCQYTSRVTNVTSFSDSLLVFINGNLRRLAIDMQTAGLDVESALEAESRQILSPAPSSSPQPSALPSLEPTVSSPPSFMPSPYPSVSPTRDKLPTTPPNFLRLSPSPTMPPKDRGDRLSVGAIASIVVFAGIFCLAGLYFYYRYASLRQERMRRRPVRASSASATSIATAGRSFRNTFRAGRPLEAATPENAVHGSDEADAFLGISPTDSLLSNKSMLSAGESGLGETSADDFDDGTKNLQDEFDQYKDQNLELLRNDVEGNLSGFEGYMSAAVTNALMGGGDDENNVEMQELLWGCGPNPEGTEIEASALFEVTDWLKRNESAEGERKRAFMQEILNKMVTSVRFGVIVAEDASRTIHESAAILGLQLAEELPVTTVIISGMRKTTRAQDMIKALNEFGDIDVAAVASGRRGFGIVRFRRRMSVDHALQRYKDGEIVILDVSIQMKVLMPSGVLESR